MWSIVVTSSVQGSAPRATHSLPTCPRAPVTTIFTFFALGACGAGPLGPAPCSAGSPPPDARSRPGFVLGDGGAVEQRFPPGAVFAVPHDGLGEALPEVDRRLPAEFALDLRPVERVATVVAGPVGHDLLQRLRFVERRQHGVG